jgi:hypothetical protein
LVEANLRSLVGVSLGGKINVKRQRSGGIEPSIDMLKVHERAQQQSGAS